MEIKIKRGSIFVYRVFDIAEEVDLQKAEQLISSHMSEGRVKIASRVRDAVIVRNEPVRFNLSETSLPSFGNFPFPRVEALATLWDYGALSIRFQIPMATLTSNDLLQLAATLNSESELLSAIDSLARTHAQEVSQLLRPALKKPSLWNIFEDYIIYFIEECDPPQNGEELLHSLQVSEILLGEAKEKISLATREAILDYTFQYAANDFVVVDWNSAVVFESNGDKDLPNILEFALTHLLEVRFYDDLLDQRLTELYDSIELGRGRIFRNHFSSISEDANTRFIEFSEFMERMGNSLKVVGDFYLARIFRGAIRRFRISDWEDNITRKTNLLARVSELLHAETNVRRGHLLEFIVIILILAELISTFVRH